MPATLDIRHESLGYSAKFARPPFSIWGAGGHIVAGICEALAPYNVTLRNIQLSSSVPTAADPVVTVQLGTTVWKFSFEKVEVTFSGFTEAGFRGIPKFLQLSTGWLQKDFPFVSHEATYYSHSFLKAGTVDEFLKTINSNPIKSAGIDLGSGASFYRAVPGKRWTTRLTIDKSLQISGAVFIALNIVVATGTVDYESLLEEAREYFGNALADLGLAVPTPEEQG
jgi:hypothetical protein